MRARSLQIKNLSDSAASAGIDGGSKDAVGGLGIARFFMPPLLKTFTTTSKTYNKVLI